MNRTLPTPEEFRQFLQRTVGEFDEDRLLTPGWDKQSDAAAPESVAVARTITGIRVGEDGTVKIVKRGHTLVKESLDQLGNSDLAETIRAFAIADESLAAMEKETIKLEREIPALSRFVAYEPTLIEHAIKQRFPVGTAGQTVHIVARTDGQTIYTLFVDNKSTATYVPPQFGQVIVARKIALRQAMESISRKNNRQGELELEIADARQTLPMLRQKIQHLIDDLDLAELNRRLNGDLISIVPNDQRQPVVLVRREVNEELTEISDELKRQLIARQLTGDKLPENVQKALGIQEAIEAVTETMSVARATAAMVKAMAKVRAPKSRAPKSKLPISHVG